MVREASRRIQSSTLGRVWGFENHLWWRTRDCQPTLSGRSCSAKRIFLSVPMGIEQTFCTLKLFESRFEFDFVDFTTNTTTGSSNSTSTWTPFTSPDDFKYKFPCHRSFVLLKNSTAGHGDCRGINCWHEECCSSSNDTTIWRSR